MHKPVDVTFLALCNPSPFYGDQGYAAACAQWGIDSKETRKQCGAEGIVYQGPFGSTIFTGRDQLPIQTKP